MWMIARNTKKRPILMHRAADDTWTDCGWRHTGWSIVWLRSPVPELELLACKVCLKANGGVL